jgi:hypothetical protein
MKWLKNTFTYWADLFREIRIWFIFRRTAIENVDLLNQEHSLRVDWIGRIYGVINLPEEVQGAAAEVQQAYVLQQITKYGDVMTKLRLSDIVYPELEKVQGTASYLIVLWPVFEDFNIWKILGNIIKSSLVLFLIYFLVKLVMSNWDALVELVSNLM